MTDDLLTPDEDALERDIADAAELGITYDMMGFVLQHVGGGSPDTMIAASKYTPEQIVATMDFLVARKYLQPKAAK